MKNNYAFSNLKENMACAKSKDLQISSKVSIEVSKFLRGKTTKKAKQILDRVLEKKQAIPFTRFTDGVGHRAGANIGAGRFPKKASEEFLKLIKSAEANAQTKGLSENLKIIHLLAQKGTNQYRNGRLSRRSYKRTHIEIVVEEQEVEDKKQISKKTTTSKNTTKSKEQTNTKKETKDTTQNKSKETLTEPKQSVNTEKTTTPKSATTTKFSETKKEEILETKKTELNKTEKQEVETQTRSEEISKDKIQEKKETSKTTEEQK